MADLRAPSVLQGIIDSEFGGVARRLALEAGIDRATLSRMLGRVRVFSGETAQAILAVISPKGQTLFARALVVDYLGEEGLQMVLKKRARATA